MEDSLDRLVLSSKAKVYDASFHIRIMHEANELIIAIKADEFLSEEIKAVLVDSIVASFESASGEMKLIEELSDFF